MHHPVESQGTAERRVNDKGAFKSLSNTVGVFPDSFIIYFPFLSLPVFCPCLLVVDQGWWHSTELKDHFCAVWVCLHLHTEFRLERLLLWRFVETWLEAPTSPQVSSPYFWSATIFILICQTTYVNTFSVSEQLSHSYFFHYSKRCNGTAWYNE